MYSASGMRTGLALMTIFLLLATYAQLNDPDPFLWMLVYGVPALVTLCAFIDVTIMNTWLWWYACFGVFIVLLTFASSLLIYNVRSKKFTWNFFSTEEGRESGGLFIVLSWLMILLYSSSYHSRKWNSEKYVFFAFALVPLISWIGYKYFLQHLVDVPEHCQGVL